MSRFCALLWQQFVEILFEEVEGDRTSHRICSYGTDHPPAVLFPDCGIRIH